MNIRHLGFHPSKVATKILQKGDTYVLGQMGWFELIQGSYRYHVYFGERIHDLGHEVQPPLKKVKITGESSGYTQMDLNSFCKNEASKKDWPLVWKEHETLLIFEFGTQIHSKKIASFDLDNTIVQTLSGKKFSSSPTDWKFMNGVVNKLTALSKSYELVILSNQLGISKGKPTKEQFKQKIEAMAKRLQLSFVLVASTSRDKYRKPCIGMWKYVMESVDRESEIDMKESFYAGDAAGRPDNWIAGNDM